MKLRTFVCVELPGTDRARLGELQANLRRHGARVSWPSSDNVHLTLAFLGDVDEERIPAVVSCVAAAAAATSPFRLRVEGTGAFPLRGRPRVLWAGIAGDVDALAALQSGVARTLEAVGFPREPRPFSAHLTIGRVKDERDRALGAVLESLAASRVAGEDFLVREVVVMRSELDSRGARHTPLATLALGAVPGE